ncbi:twin-arginine translocation pathway signal [Salipiger sp. IMCC34102]|uniref:lipid-binding SYLF domain-containing protein n=1 Tax=Salipiger sp. IMCC34102 TaxID=2510647 RepID=UPI00101B5D44|nr:YSC84-related protein [Salipiger sp. IMCC34102]RYH03117.1 twin-arginine translocation pathway signal [Salipiger sp. IMCC34102]
MTVMTRRSVLWGAAATGLAACGNGVGNNNATLIDARVSSTVAFMHDTYPGTRDLSERSAGRLVMPLVTEAGLGLGGAYGRGALQINGSTVDYYSVASASAGLQIGAQQYSHVLFFTTANALAEFRASPGWVAGADLEYATPEQGEVLRAETLTSLSPVIAILFAQSGLRVGATLKGSKYTRIIP